VKEKQNGLSRFFGSVDGLIPARIKNPILLTGKKFNGSAQKRHKPSLPYVKPQGLRGSINNASAQGKEDGRIHKSNAKMPL
jgi:hypothetical protein